MNVPLLDLKAQFAALKDEIMPAVVEVFDTQHFIGGPKVAELERAVAEYSDCAGAVGVSSGTDALVCSLMALGVGQDLPACRTGGACPGADEVITTPFTFFATAGSIWRVGARPVFVDIDPETYNIDASKVEAAVTDRTRAILPVHLFGQLADMEAICEIAGRHGLHVIEDAAQSIGATRNGRKAGSFGTCGCFSFYPSKNLAAAGDGGMIVSTDPDFVERCAMFRNHGSKPKYYHKWVGGNFRLDALQAAVLLAKLAHLEDWSQARRRNAAVYDGLFGDCDAVRTPKVKEENVSIYNQYVLRVPDRDALVDHLKARNIGCEIYYPLSLHKQECFAGLGYGEGDFPAAEQAEREVLALPIYPELSEEQIRYVAETVKAFCG